MLAPSTTRFVQNPLPVGGHFFYLRAREPRLFVSRTPNENLQQHRREIDTFFGKSILNAPCVRSLGFGGDDVCVF